MTLRTSWLVDNGVGKHLFKEVKEKGKDILIRDVWFDELSAVLELEKEVHDGMENKELLVDVTRNEFIESLHLDYVLGAYEQDKLVAVALIIDNRDTERNLAKKFGVDPLKAYTFDIVFVKKEYRGLGLQEAFIEVAKAQAKIDGATSIWTTVSKENKHSYDNMINQGFKPFKENVSMYGGHNRDVLTLNID